MLAAVFRTCDDVTFHLVTYLATEAGTTANHDSCERNFQAS